MVYYYILRACVRVSFYGGKSSARIFLKLFLDIKKSLCRLQSNKITYSVPSSEGLGTNKKQVKI